MLRSFFTTKAVEVKDRVFRVVISDETLDRHDTVIKLDGWHFDNYRKNPVVLFQHASWTSDPDYVVAKCIKLWVEKKQVWAEVEFEPEGQNEIADKLVNKLRFGSISATSVGFDPMQYGMGDTRIDPNEDDNIFYFREQDLLEFSFVIIPSNPNAVSKDGGEGTADSIDNNIDEFVKHHRALAPVTADTTTTNTATETKIADTPGPDPYRTQLIKLKRANYENSRAIAG